MATTEQTITWHLVTDPNDPSQLPNPDDIVISIRKSGLTSVDIYEGGSIIPFQPLVNWRSCTDTDNIVAWARIKFTDSVYDHLVSIAGLNAQGKVKRASKYLDLLKP